MFAKNPFVRILIPLIVGILATYFFNNCKWSIWFLALGSVIILLSFFIYPLKRFTLRWLFGLGINLFLIAIGSIFTAMHQKAVKYNFIDTKETYRAIVINTPVSKPHYLAFKVNLPDRNKKIVCNIQSSVLSRQLTCGDEFLFNGKIEPFSNLGNPDEFDYADYMTNNGFSGTTFIAANEWDTTNKTYWSPTICALKCQQKLVYFYKSLHLSDKEFSILSALTLGYNNSLTNDLKQSFRATGTAHILAISGLHVGIIFAVINFLFLDLKRRRKFFIVAQLFVILLLWIYAFVTGLSPSVIRSCIMLSLLCLSQLLGRRIFSSNSVAFSAFIMLLINPLWLFDISFQFSFAAVTSILFLQPYIEKIFSPKNRILNYFWQLFVISCIVQLTTFPLALYYFGAFPSYFFICNLLIIPLVGIILYTALSFVILAPLVIFFPSFESVIYFYPFIYFITAFR